MSPRTQHRRPLGSFSAIDPDQTDAEMRTVLIGALDEIPPEIRARIADRRPRTSWQDHDEALRLIAEHLTIRLRQHVHCEYRSVPAISTVAHGTPR